MKSCREQILPVPHSSHWGRGFPSYFPSLALWAVNHHNLLPWTTAGDRDPLGSIRSLPMNFQIGVRGRGLAPSREWMVSRWPRKSVWENEVKRVLEACRFGFWGFFLGQLQLFHVKETSLSIILLAQGRLP